MSEENKEGAQAGEILPVKEQQAETNKEVKAQVKAANKPKTKAQTEEKPIAAASNPGRPDVKYIEKGDLLEPVE